MEKDIHKVIKEGIDQINRFNAEGKSIVANYVLRSEDYEALRVGLRVEKQRYITLAPRLDVVHKDRGRGINDWEFERIKYHYDTGIANPTFGEVIDTSEMSLNEVVEIILKRVKL